MRKIIIFLLLDLLVLAAAASAQDVSVRYQGQLIGSRGLPLASQSIAVCTQPANTNTQPCSPLATLATSTSTSSGGANPLTSDTNGNFFFYAAPGKYTVQAYGPQVSGQFVQPDTILSCSPTGLCFVSGNGAITLLNAQPNAAPITGNSSAQTVYTYTLPANTVANLKGIRIHVAWTHSTGNATIAYNLTLNGQSLFGAGPNNVSGGAGFVNDTTVLNTGATTGTAASVFNLGVASGPDVFSNAVTSLSWSSPQVLTFTFNVANTDAVTPIQWTVELIQ